MKKLIWAYLFLALCCSAQVPVPTVPMQGRIGVQANSPLLNGGIITIPDADYILAYPDFTGLVLRFESSVPLTQTRNIIHNLPSKQEQRFGFEFAIQNATQGNHDIVFRGNTGTGVTIPNAQTVTVMFDGTNYVAVGGAGAGGAGSAPQKIIYTSQIPGIVGNANVAFGQTGAGAADDSAALNAALSGGNVLLIVNGQYGLAHPLRIWSNTKVQCQPGMGFIMLPNSNENTILNAHENSPTTVSSTGHGFNISNIVDHNIWIDGCIINSNSYNAVNDGGAHRFRDSTSTGEALFGIRMTGVDTLLVTNNLSYDTPTWGIVASNATNVLFQGNRRQSPDYVWTTYIKNDDGYDIIGPASNVVLRDNYSQTSDDAICVCADGVTSPPLVGTEYWYHWQSTPIKNGPITNVLVDGLNCDLAENCVDLLSMTERMDRIQVNNVYGVTRSYPARIQTWDCSYCLGDMGSISFDNFNVVPRNGSGKYQVGTHFTISNVIDNLSLSNFTVNNPSDGFPIFKMTKGTIKNLTLHGITINSTAGVPPQYLLRTDSGQIQNLVLNHVAINGTVGAVMGGGVTPQSVTFSNYAGTSPIFATGYSPPIQNGDAFGHGGGTPPPTVLTPILQTTFNEGAAGADLTGTTPAVCTVGYCSGPWVLSSGSPSCVSPNCTSLTYASGGGATTSVVSQNEIGISLSEFVINFTLTACTNECLVKFRMVDSHNYFLMNIRQVDAVNGNWALTLFQCAPEPTCAWLGGISQGSNPLSALLGNYQITVTNTTVSVTTPVGSIGPKTVTPTVGAHLAIGTSAVNAPAGAATFSSLTVSTALPGGGDGTGSSGGLSDPGANGIVKRIGLNTTAIAIASDFPPSTASLSSLTSATSTNQLLNSSFLQDWRWHLTGTSTTSGLNIAEDLPSTNTGNSVLFNVSTGVGSTIDVAKFTAHYPGVNGLDIDLNGNAVTKGTAQFIGPVQLPSIKGASSLATDVNGNIIAGTGGGGGSVPLNGLTAATANGSTLNNGNHSMEWRWQLTGSTSTNAIGFGESGVSTNTGPSNLVGIWTRAGTTLWPLKVLANIDTTLTGFGVTPTGDIQAVGGATFIGPLRLPAIVGASSLGTDGSGNIIAGTGGGGGGNVWSVSNSYPMSTTTGATVFTQPMVTPTADSTYYLTWQLQQVDTGSGPTCNAGALGVVLSFTEAVSNTPITAYISGRAFNAPGGTNNFSAGTTVDATNYFVGFPFEFTAKAGVPVTFTLSQTTASNCTTGQNFALRAHLKAW